jgi:hypothetical protein
MQGVMWGSARAVPEDVDWQQSQEIGDWNGGVLQFHQVLMLDMQIAFPSYGDPWIKRENVDDYHIKTWEALPNIIGHKR